MALFLVLKQPPTERSRKRCSGEQGRAEVDFIETEFCCPAFQAGYHDPRKVLFLHGWQSVPGGDTSTFDIPCSEFEIFFFRQTSNFQQGISNAEGQAEEAAPDLMKEESGVRNQGSAIVIKLSFDS